MSLSYSELARLADLSVRTISNITKGYVKRPRDPYDLIKLGIALKLSREEINQILNVSGHGSVDILSSKAQSAVQQELLGYWVEDKPNQLPYSTQQFVGREEELRSASKLLINEGSCYFVGMAGVGKTFLAIELATRLIRRYKDGILWLSLGNEDNLKSALYQLAIAYGLDISHIESSSESRAVAVRNLLSQKKSLLILDNVKVVEELELLMPNQGTSTIVTTRNGSLCNPNQTIEVKPFNQEEGSHYLKTFLKDIEPDNESIEKIVELLQGLPLALSIVGNRIKNTKHITIKEVAYLLENQIENPLSILGKQNKQGVGEITAAFDLSYKTLNDNHKLVFSALSLFSGNSFSIPAVHALLANNSTTITKFELAQLSSLSLIQESVIDKQTHQTITNVEASARFRFHGLVKSFATEKLRENFGQLIPEFLSRLEDYYATLLKNNGMERYGEIDLEYGNIIGILEYGISDGNLEKSLSIIEGLSFISLGSIGYWDIRGYWDDALRYLSHLSDLDIPEDIQAFVKFKQGVFYFRKSQFEESLVLIEHGLKLASKSLNPREFAWFTAYSSEFLGRINLQKDVEGAIAYLQEGMEVLASISERRAEQYQGYLGVILSEVSARYLNNLDQAEKNAKQGLDKLGSEVTHANLTANINLGVISAMKGDLEESNLYFDEAISAAEFLGNQQKLATAVTNRGINTQRRGDIQQAKIFYERSLKIRRQIGDISGVAYTLGNLAMIYMIWSQNEEALKLIDESINLAEEYHIHQTAGFTRATKGQILLHIGRYDLAEQELTKALEFANLYELRSLLSYVLIFQADLHLLKEQPVKGLEKIEHALELNGSWENQELGMIYSVQGRILDALNEVDEAKEAHLRAVKILEGKDAYEYAVSRLYLLKFSLSRNLDVNESRFEIRRFFENLNAEREIKILDSLTQY